MVWNEEEYRRAEYHQSRAASVYELTKQGDCVRYRKAPVLGTVSPGLGVCQELCAKWIRMLIKGVYQTPQQRMGRLDRLISMVKAIVRHHRGMTPPLRRTLPKNRYELAQALFRQKIRPWGKSYGSNLPYTTEHLTQKDLCDAYGINISQIDYYTDWRVAAKRIPGWRGWSIDEHFTFAWENLERRSGHILGFKSKWSDIIAFDPNFGEYLVPKRNFLTWLRTLMRDKYNINDDDNRRFELTRYSKNITEKQQRRTQHFTKPQLKTAMQLLQATHPTSPQFSSLSHVDPQKCAFSEPGELVAFLEGYGIDLGDARHMIRPDVLTFCTDALNSIERDWLDKVIEQRQQLLSEVTD